MKAIVCELCGSKDIVKQNGMYVCQHCGTKYDLEEAKKLMIDGTVNVVGKVTIDKSSSYDHILQLARDAYNDKRFESAYNYYNQAIEIKPNEPECILCQGLSLLAKEPIQSSIPPSCENRVIRTIDILNEIPASEEKNNQIMIFINYLNSACESSSVFFDEEINNLKLQKMETRFILDKLMDYNKPSFVANMNAAEDDKIDRHNEMISKKIKALEERKKIIDAFNEEYTEKLLNCTDINTQFICYYQNGSVDKIVELYPLISLTKEVQKELTIDDNYMFWAVENERVDFVKVLVSMGCDINKVDSKVSPLFMVTAFKPKNDESRNNKLEIARILLDNGAIIDPNETSEKGRSLLNSDSDSEIMEMIFQRCPEARNNIKLAPACYIATCVYGSYDCPEVWTLRRFRDFSLAKTWYGRVFIRIYYTISPTLVKWFGNKVWFRNNWKSKLNRIVNALNSKGVENTPYEEEW